MTLSDELEGLTKHRIDLLALLIFATLAVFATGRFHPERVPAA